MIDWDSLVLAPLQNVFGEPVTYVDDIGVVVAGHGIFDEAYREVNLVDSGAVTTEHPVLGIRTSDFSVMPRQTGRITILRTGKTYVIREVQIDGHGAAKLLLNNESVP